MQDSAAATPILSRDNLISVGSQSLSDFVIVIRQVFTVFEVADVRRIGGLGAAGVVRD